MENFHLINIEDKLIFEKYFNLDIMNSEYQFTTLFAWRELYNFRYIIYDDFLLVFGNQNNGNVQCYFPIGTDGDLESCIRYICSVFTEIKQPFNMRPLSGEMLKKIEHFIPTNVFIGTKESYSDYICRFDNILNMKGKLYKRKRKEINFFTNNYKFEYETIEKNNSEVYLKALYKILEQNGVVDLQEWTAYKRIFCNFSQLGVKGGVIKIGNIIEAIAVGEKCNNMIVMHIRRCNRNYRGIYPTMLQLLIKNEFLHSGCQWINFQDDMGLINLRKSKLSYNPDIILKKYFVWGGD